ncbi:hypothetical protein B0H13DRAFT_482370 [Mycena leptocephala]|nr:hypothetical protein B0H13DRAFT_482370 [Mycena leptocephala]
MSFVTAASALAAPLESMKDPIQPSSTSAALPEPSSTTEFVPGRPGQRFACDNPNKWPNGMISLLMMDGKKMNQDSCLRPKNPGVSSIVANPTATFYQYDNSTAVVSNSSVTVSPNQSNATCGFLLDVGLLAQVLEAPGGPCDQINRTLATLDPSKDAAKITDLKKGYTNLTDIITSSNNTAFIDLSLNAMQVDEVAKFMEKPVYSYKANASDPSLFSRLDAVADLMNKTSASSLILAGQIDAVLNATFPGVKTNLTSTYTNFVRFAAANAANTTNEVPPPGWCSCSSPPASSSVSHTLVSSSTHSSSKTSTPKPTTSTLGHHPTPSSSPSAPHSVVSSSTHRSKSSPSGPAVSTVGHPTPSHPHVESSDLPQPTHSSKTGTKSTHRTQPTTSTSSSKAAITSSTRTKSQEHAETPHSSKTSPASTTSHVHLPTTGIPRSSTVTHPHTSITAISSESISKAALQSTEDHPVPPTSTKDSISVSPTAPQSESAKISSSPVPSGSTSIGEAPQHSEGGHSEPSHTALPPHGPITRPQPGEKGPNGTPGSDKKPGSGGKQGSDDGKAGPNGKQGPNEKPEPNGKPGSNGKPDPKASA